MTILDANVLIYAYDNTAPQHAAASRWIEDLLSGTELVGFPWVSIWAFLRVSTNPRLWTNPKSLNEAFSVVKQWLAHPRVIVVQPGPRHTELLEKFVTEHQSGGPSLTDAVLAALAIENGAILASTDQDFRRYPSLRWVNPLAETDK